MKKFYSLLKAITFTMFALLSFQTIFAQQQGDWEWLISAGAGGHDWGRSMVRDNNDNIFVTGVFTHTVVFGKDTNGVNVSLTSIPSTPERFIAKYNNLGQCLWAKSVCRITSKNGDKVGSIDVDTLGNVFVGGISYGNIVTDDTTLTNTNGADFFIASLDKNNGNLNWVRRGGSDNIIINDTTTLLNHAYCNSVCADGNGGVYATGNFMREMDIDIANNNTMHVTGNQTINTSGQLISSVFILHYNDAGNMQWESILKGNTGYGIVGYSIKKDNSGSNVFVYGNFEGQQYVIDNFNDTLDSIYPTVGVYSDIFLLQYTANGNYVKKLIAGGYSRQSASELSIDNDNSIFISGSFNYSVAINGDSVNSMGTNDIFFAKIDFDFNIDWVKYIQGEGDDCSNHIVTNDENVFLTGYFSDTVYFSATDVTDNDSLRDIFIAWYDKDNGDFVFALQAGGSGVDEGWALSVDNCENIYVTGFFTDTASFEDTTLTSNIYKQAFIGKYNTRSMDFVPDDTICPYTTITLRANLATGYHVLSWSNDSINVDSIIVSPPVTTTYTLTVSEGSCFVTDQAIITIKEVSTLTWEGDTTNQFGEITTTSYTHSQTPNDSAFIVTLNPDNDWFIAENWTCDILPDSTWDIVIPSNPIGGDTVFPVVDRSSQTITFIAQCKNITIENGAKLTITNNDTTDTQENPKWNDASILRVYGDWNNQNTTELALGEGEVSFRGDSSFQNIYGPNRWGNLEMRNDSGLIIDTTYMQNLTGIFYQTKGTLHTNGKLTLVSDHNKTALIDAGNRDGSPVTDNNIEGEVTVQRFVFRSTLLPNMDEVHYMGCPMKDFLYREYADAFNHTVTPGSWGVMVFQHQYFGYPFDAYFNISHENRQEAYTYDYADPPYSLAERLSLNAWGVPRDTIMPPLLGIAINFYGQDTGVPFQFTGEINNFTEYSMNWSHTEKTDTNYTESHEGWMLFGNPYPCPIDWQQVDSTDRAGFDNAVYFWDPYMDTLHSQGSEWTNIYGCYRFWVNPVIGTGAYVEHPEDIGPPQPGDTASWYSFDDVSTVIPSMQGVLLRVSDSLGITRPNVPITIRSSAKVRNLSPRPYSDNRHFYKSIVNVKKIRIEAIATDSFVDGLLVYSNEDATTGFDKQYDAFKFMNSVINFPNIYVIGSDSTKMAINAMPEEEMNTINVGFTAHKEGIYQIRRRNLENYPAEVGLEVIDRETNDTTYLLRNSEKFAFNYSSIKERKFTINIVKDTENNESIYYAIDTINDNFKSKEKLKQKLLNPTMKCYPNPTSQTINIEYELASTNYLLDNPIDARLEVYNNYGTLVQQIFNEKQYAGKKYYKLDLENNGMYIIRLTLDNKTYKQIIIKQ